MDVLLKEQLIERMFEVGAYDVRCALGKEDCQPGSNSHAYPGHNGQDQHPETDIQNRFNVACNHALVNHALG